MGRSRSTPKEPPKVASRRSLRVANNVIKDEPCDEENTPSTSFIKKKIKTPARMTAETPARKTPATRARKTPATPDKKTSETPARNTAETPARKTTATPAAKKTAESEGKKKTESSGKKRRCNDVLDIAIKDEVSTEMYKLVIGTAFLGEWIVNALLEENDHELIYSVSPMKNVDQNALLRCVPTSQNFSLLLEASFLNKMFSRSVGYMFNDLLKMEEVEVDDKDVCFTYLITSVKDSCPVSELCKDFDSPEQRIKTCSQLFADILDIIEVTCRFGYVINEVTLDDFSYDIYSRRVFLSNRRHVFIGWERLGVPAVFQEKTQVSWKGSSSYAPHSYHLNNDNPITESDCVESMFYLYLDMLGLLPWSTKPSLLVSTKNKWYDNAALSLGSTCPENISIALSRFWRECCLGSRVDINRDKSLKNGELSLRRPFPHDKLKERIIPRACMLSYTVLHKELTYIADSVATPNGVLNKEMINCFTPMEEAILENVNLRKTVQGLQLQHKSLVMEAEYRLRHRAEMEVHQGKNDIIIERHIRSLQMPYADVKEEPMDDYPIFDNYWSAPLADDEDV